MTATANAGSTSRRVADKAHDAVDNAAGRAEQIEETLKNSAHATSEAVLGAARRAGEQSETALNSVGDYVRDNPLKSVGFAFAAGVVASLLLRR